MDLENGLTYARSKGAKKFATVGFCWGAWVTFNACTSNTFVAGASFHPSVHICKWVFDVDLGELTSKVTVP